MLKIRTLGYTKNRSMERPIDIVNTLCSHLNAKHHMCVKKSNNHDGDSQR